MRTVTRSDGYLSALDAALDAVEALTGKLSYVEVRDIQRAVAEREVQWMTQVGIEAVVRRRAADNTRQASG